MVSLAFGLALFGLASGSPVGNKSVVLGADCVADWGKCGGKEYDGTANPKSPSFDDGLPTSLLFSAVGLTVR